MKKYIPLFIHMPDFGMKNVERVCKRPLYK